MNTRLNVHCVTRTVVLIFAIPCMLVAQETDQTSERRSGKCYIEHAVQTYKSFTAVKGTGEVQDAKGNTIAKGNLLLVEGWLALQCPRGTKFKHIPKSDTETSILHDWLQDWPGQPAGKVAALTLNENGEWEVANDNFFILMMTPHNMVVFEWAASFARESTINVPYKMKLALWGNNILVGTGGGKINVVHGRITGGKNIDVTAPDGKITRYK